MHLYRLLFYTCCIIALPGLRGSLAAQESLCTVVGRITDADNGQALEFVNVFVAGSTHAVQTDQRGRYSLQLPVADSVVLTVSRIGYAEQQRVLRDLRAGERRELNLRLQLSEASIQAEVTDRRLDQPGLIREDVSKLKYLPTTSGNLESILPHIALGASGGTGGELSSQYNVRGGNYDENLIYVNDFEIYRPQLIRSGQQEGLTFANMDLVRDLYFSSGGFQARYGDKQSSVLDVRYKLPEEFKGSASASFLGGSAHVEGSRALGQDGYRKFRYLAGARYKTTRYLLNTLDVTGEYIPDFSDVQAYLTYDLTRDLQLAYLGNFNSSLFRFKPASGRSGTGLINFSLSLRTQYEGQEVDDFTTWFHGVSLTWLPDRKRNPMYMKWLVSTYRSNENERIDIIGSYRLVEIETNLGSEEAGEEVAVLGEGVQHSFVRNYLQANVTNLEWKGGIELQKATGDTRRTASDFVQWGARIQYERIEDRINEWERLDSAGYSLIHDETQVNVRRVYKSQNFLESARFSAFIQDIYTSRREDRYELQFTYGIRANYWNLNGEWLVAPRAQLSYKPLHNDRDISYRLAAGWYHQPAFYRELRRLDGTLNTDVRAQKSSHLLAGVTYDFTAGDEHPVKYRLIAETYYKQLWDLVSYDVDNVRIRYSGENDADGYVAGVDLRLNGEFVPGVESWFNVSFLRVREQLRGVTHMRRDIGDPQGYEVSDVPRPTDQVMLFSVYFQDYLPRNEDFKVHMSFTYGTGMPFGLPENNRVYRNTYRYSPYRRVDIGFSWQLWDKSKLEKKPGHFLRFTESTWVSLEVFNLLQMANVANNTWIKSIYNVQYAIPNHLTSRRINLRVRVDF